LNTPKIELVIVERALPVTATAINTITIARPTTTAAVVKTSSGLQIAKIIKKQIIKVLKKSFIVVEYLLFVFPIQI
jgi:hypothetical protein